MAKIEALVELPNGAGPLETFGRNYAMQEDGTVIGVYDKPPDPIREGTPCSVYEDGELRLCTDQEHIDTIEHRQALIDAQAATGEARWFDDADDLPMVMDGGCSVVTVYYNQETETVRAYCNGVA